MVYSMVELNMLKKSISLLKNHILSKFIGD